MSVRVRIDFSVSVSFNVRVSVRVSVSSGRLVVARGVAVATGVAVVVPPAPEDGLFCRRRLSDLRAKEQLRRQVVRFACQSHFR